MIEFVRQKSTPFRRPAHLPPPVTGKRRYRLVRVRRRPATRPPEVPPGVRRQLAVRFSSRTRWIPEQAIGATSRLQGVVGRTTGPHRLTTAVPGRGRIVVRQGRKLLVLGPHRRDGRHVRVVSVLRRHGQEVSGRQGKGAHVLVPGPGQCRQLEAWLAINLKRSQWSVAAGATTLEPGLNRPAAIACHRRAVVPPSWMLRLRSLWVPFSSS